MLTLQEKVPVSTFRSALYQLADAGLVGRVKIERGIPRARHYYELADHPPHFHFFCTQCHALE